MYTILQQLTLFTTQLLSIGIYAEHFTFAVPWCSCGLLGSNCLRSLFKQVLYIVSVGTAVRVHEHSPRRREVATSIAVSSSPTLSSTFVLIPTQKLSHQYQYCWKICQKHIFSNTKNNKTHFGPNYSVCPWQGSWGDVWVFGLGLEFWYLFGLGTSNHVVFNM